MLFLNRARGKVGKTTGPGKKRPAPFKTRLGHDNDVYFRCREDVTLPAAARARTAFIPIELYFRDRPLTAEELSRACVDERKVISLYWNFSFKSRRKARGVTNWFQHDRRRDSGFPFTPGPAARIHIPKNITVQVQAGHRLGAVVAMVNAGLDWFRGEDEEYHPYLEPPSRLPPTQPAPQPRRHPAGRLGSPDLSSTSVFSASSFL